MESFEIDLKFCPLSKKFVFWAKTYPVFKMFVFSVHLSNEANSQ